MKKEFWYFVSLFVVFFLFQIIKGFPVWVIAVADIAAVAYIGFTVYSKKVLNKDV